MKTIRQQFSVPFSFPVIFTRDAFGQDNPALADVMRSAGSERWRVLVVIDSGVAGAAPWLMERIVRYAELHRDCVELVLPPFIVRGGEVCKNDPVEVNQIHSLVEKNGLCRHSFILAIGGGAVLDAVGFAAASAHRGIRFIRMPTTTLAQNDAGVGVKNGVNAFGRKNFLGAFAPPFAVINDFDFLKTLPARDLRAGISEAVKVALIKDRSFFEYLYAERDKLASFEPEVMEWMIVRCAELHMEHIGASGDPFEFGSARPLDFGHWTAHKLEDLTKGEIRHGEAVAIGIALDSLYSFQQGLISEMHLHRILVTLEEIGFELYHPALNWFDIGMALQEFQEHLGGTLSIPLLDGVGGKREVHDIDLDAYRNCVARLGVRFEKKSVGRKLHEQATDCNAEQRSS